MIKCLTLIVSIIFLFITASANVITVGYFGDDGGSPPPACDVSQEPIVDESTAASYTVGQYSIARYRASQFVYDGTNGKAICSATLRCSYTGSTDRYYTFSIYSDSGNNPDSALGTSDLVELSDLGTSETDAVFNFSIPTSALTNGSTYWVVLAAPAPNNSTHYARWYTTYLSGAENELNKYSSDASSWTTGTTNESFKYTLYSL
jgi:hypothetical protein